MGGSTSDIFSSSAGDDPIIISDPSNLAIIEIESIVLNAGEYVYIRNLNGNNLSPMLSEDAGEGSLAFQLNTNGEVETQFRSGKSTKWVKIKE